MELHRQFTLFDMKTEMRFSVIMAHPHTFSKDERNIPTLIILNDLLAQKKSTICHMEYEPQGV